MKLKNLIDNRNKALYNRIATQFSVQLQRNEDWRADAWTSNIDNEIAFIKYCDEEAIDYPQAALTRELLCLELQMKGFKRVFTGVSLKKEHQNKLASLIKILDFELQNHKIFESFVELGFHKEQFYGYENDWSGRYILDILQEEGYSLMSLSSLYLSFVTPSGNWSQAIQTEIQQHFYSYNQGAFQQHFKKINSIIESWKSSKSYDATPFIIDFCKNVGLVETWLSYEKNAVDINSKTFPESGFFIQKPFTLEDIQQIYG